MDANGTVHVVTGRQLDSGKTIYEVAATVETPTGPQQVKLATFDAELVSKAKALENQRASFSYEVKQKGQYTNWYLNDIAPEGQTTSSFAPPPATSTNGIPITPAGANRGAPRGGGGSWKPRSPEETASIVKQNVLGTAHHFVSALYQGLGPEFLEEAKSKAKEYAAELFEIAKPKGSGTSPVPVSATPVAAPIVPTVSTPAEVAVAVPGVQVGAVPTDATTIAWN